MKFKFVGGDGERKRTPRRKTEEGDEAFKFVSKEGETFQFKGSSSVGGASSREETKKLRNDLAACLVDMAQEWKKDPVGLDEAKETVIACIDQAESEGGKAEEWRRMRYIVDQLEELDELVKYIYNYMLRASGLSVNRVIGRRD